MIKFSFLKSPLYILLRDYTKLYYKYAGPKIILYTFVSLISGLLTGISIVMLIPLLGMVQGPNESSLSVFPSSPFSSFISGLSLNLNLNGTLILISLIFFLKAIVHYCLEILDAHIITELKRKIQFELIQDLNASSYSYFLSKKNGEIVNLVLHESSRLVGGFNYYSNLLNQLLGISILLTFSFLINYKLTLLVLSIGVPIFLVFRLLNSTIVKNSQELTNTYSVINHLFLQFVSHFKYIKILGQHAKGLLSLISHELYEQKKILIRQKKLQLSAKLAVEPVLVLLICSIIYYLVEKEGEPLSSVLVSVHFVYRTSSKLFALPKEVQKILSKSGSIGAVEKLNQEIKHNREARENLKKVSQFVNNITFKNVSFSFGNQQVLKDINLNLKKCSTVGIVGESGAGKTTLFDLLIGLLEPSSGEISIDGANYKDIDKVSFRSLFGYVTQDPVIFNDSILNNITFWKEPNTLAVKDAITKANCYDFIMGKEGELETMVGERGVRLSGGQKQRLAIARELYRDPEILIFDEATSSLDSLSEKLIHESIRTLAKSKTILMISHRLSTLKECDYIYVLKDGLICEEGNWEELINKRSYFYQMCEMQNTSSTLFV